MTINHNIYLDKAEQLLHDAKYCVGHLHFEDDVDSNGKEKAIYAILDAIDILNVLQVRLNEQQRRK